jgi:hypothetical protein
MLRSKLDYSFPNQRAEAFVGGAESGQPVWKPAGVWYLAGSNTCVFSSPGQELGPTQRVVQTSNPAVSAMTNSCSPRFDAWT